MGSLVIYSWNACGIRGKITEVTDFLYRKSVDILFINETKLKATETLKIRNYNSYCSNRENAAGGVAILIRRGIPHERVEIKRVVSIEHICIRLQSNIYLIAAYNKPSNSFSHSDLDSLLEVSNKVLVVGDLNARHTNWSCHRNNRNGLTLNSYIQNNNVTILHTDSPTHIPYNNGTPTFIDLVINKNVINMKKLQVLNELNSDHLPVYFTLGNESNPKLKRSIFDYKGADWERFRDILNDKIITNSKIETKEDVDEEVLKLTRNIQHARDKVIKMKTVIAQNTELSDSILKEIKFRNYLRKQWQKTGSLVFKELYMEKIKEVRAQIAEFRNKKWSEKLSKINTRDKSLWRMTKVLKSEYEEIPCLREGNITALTDREKVELIASQFENVHKIELQNNTIEQSNIVSVVNNYLQGTLNSGEDWYKYHTSPKEIYSIIKNVSSHKAPGMDKIQNVVLKNLSKKAIVQLNYIINSLFKLMYFPQHWKTANIIPVPKPGKDKNKPTSYRPISLLCSISKIVEKIILDRIKKHEELNKISRDIQFGFKKQHSTVQQVVRIVNDISKNFNLDKITVMVLLDIQKAFDKVWIDGLMYKMIKQNYPEILIRLIHSYITNRKFKVVINDTKSRTKEIEAGVPQGSVLGPQLFSIFLNDIPEFERTNIALFADDTAIYAHSFCAVVAAKQIQIHLNMLEKYYSQWKVTLNPEKTELIVFSKKMTGNKIFSPVKVYGQQVAPSNNVKYLGVHLDSKLTYKHHLKMAIQKVYPIMKKVYPLLVKNSSVTMENKRLIYTSILRPVLVYGAPVWCSAAMTNLKPLQVFQNKCMRLILNRNRYVRIAAMHRDANLEPIIEYIRNLGQKFYKYQLQNENAFLKDITRIRYNNSIFRIKHKLPYQNLPIFNEESSYD